MLITVNFCFTIFQMDSMEMDLDLNEVSPKRILRACPRSVLTSGLGFLNLGETNLLTVFIFFRHAFDRSPAIFLPGRWSSNTFDIGFESACSTTCIGVTQGIRYTVLVPFRNMCTLPRLIPNLCLKTWCGLSQSMTNLT